MFRDAGFITVEERIFTEGSLGTQSQNEETAPALIHVGIFKC